MLENSNNVFEDHVSQHHSVIRYLEYFLFLKTKSKGSYNGIEYFVNRCIEQKNLNFLPKTSNTCFLVRNDAAKKLDETKVNKEEAILNMVGSFWLTSNFLGSEGV